MLLATVSTCGAALGSLFYPVAARANIKSVCMELMEDDTVHCRRDQVVIKKPDASIALGN